MWSGFTDWCMIGGFFFLGWGGVGVRVANLFLTWGQG